MLVLLLLCMQCMEWLECMECPLMEVLVVLVLCSMLERLLTVQAAAVEYTVAMRDTSLSFVHI